ncbi:hypothetical protein HB790_11115 [Listeria welshimeri]|nr:hypothetical protein [Listeria welshimeri]MBC1634506.1 hypothetical protein [Listeria welshimeri]MBC1716419.1 hypothetical protein [Listeria welshimeri]
MNEEILNIYENVQNESLSIFFDDLISFINKYHLEFSKYISGEYLESMEKFEAKNFILGHSDDNFEVAIPYYKDLIEQGLDKENICRQVSSLVWDLSGYMLDKICPNCHDSNLRLTSSIDKKQIITFCDECLYTGIDGKFVEIDEEILPANKNQVSSYLKQQYM